MAEISTNLVIYAVIGIALLAFGLFFIYTYMWPNDVGPDELEKAIQSCKTACASAGALAETCEEWKNMFCSKPYTEGKTCSDALPSGEGTVTCEAPVKFGEDCSC